MEELSGSVETKPAPKPGRKQAQADTVASLKAEMAAKTADLAQATKDRAEAEARVRQARKEIDAMKDKLLAALDLK